MVNGIVGDADALWGPRKSIDTAVDADALVRGRKGVLSRPRAVWHKLNGFALFVDSIYKFSNSFPASPTFSSY